MSSTQLARDERVALCDLLDEVGPDAPTLCADWTTALLAAHLVVRERRPDVGPGLVMGGGAARHTARVTARTAERVPYGRLVERVRSGPPPWIRPVNGPMNLVEFTVHHEDVRRAVDGWAPRWGMDDLQDALWPYLRSGTRLRCRSMRDVDLSIARPGDEPVAVGKSTKSGRPVVATAEPVELTLFFF
ncbi:uncharacterized protein METZ01_LOCUS346495, partial [marine metagenome]